MCFCIVSNPVPGPPANISAVTKSSTSVRVRWLDVPLDQQNGIITKYEVEIRERTGSSNFLPASTKTATENGTYLVTALKPYTDYRFRVRAYTIIGPGTYSPSHVTRTHGTGMSCLQLYHTVVWLSVLLHTFNTSKTVLFVVSPCVIQLLQ